MYQTEHGQTQARPCTVVVQTVAWSPNGRRVTAFRGDDREAVQARATAEWRSIDEWCRGAQPVASADPLLTGGYVATVTRWSAE